MTFNPDPEDEQTTETQQFTVNGVTAPTAQLVQTNQGVTNTLAVSLGGQEFSTTTTTTDVQGRVTGITQDINQAKKRCQEPLFDKWTEFE